MSLLIGSLALTVRGGRSSRHSSHFPVRKSFALLKTVGRTQIRCWFFEWSSAGSKPFSSSMRPNASNWSDSVWEARSIFAGTVQSSL